MLIIVEGVDGSGKTTLVQDIAHMMPDNTVIEHRGPIKQHPLIEYIGKLDRYDPNADNFISDRWHIGEMVYGPLYRNESKVTPALARYIDMVLQSRGCLKILMSTPYETVMERLRIRGEDFLQEQHVRLVHQFYEETCTEDWLRVPGKYHAQKTVEKIIRLACERQHEANEKVDYSPSFVGHLSPDIVFVLPANDEEPEAIRRPTQLLAGFPYAGTTGHYLTTALVMLNASQRIAFVTAGDIPEEGWKGVQLVTVGSSAHYRTKQPHISIPSPRGIKDIDTYGARAFLPYVRSVL